MKKLKTNKCSAVAEMGERLATIDMGQKLECALFERGSELGPHVTQCGLGRGRRLYQVASSRLATTDMGRNWRLCPLGMELGSHLTQCCQGRGLPS